MGDGIYELKVRDYIIKKYGSMPPNKLHFTAVKMVKATFQSNLYEEISPMLVEKEISILKRGRNAQSSSIPKNANPAEYRRATGVEALFGYLYFCNQHERIDELFDVAINLFEKNEV